MTYRPDADGPRLVTVRGRHFVVADDKPTFWDKAEAGLWEPETLAALEDAVTTGCDVLDIGAWVGPTVLFSGALGAGRIIAVEADPRALELLRGNLAANPGLTARVTVIAAAATPDGAPVRLGAARKRGDSMSSALLSASADVWEAPGVTPAALFAKLDGEAPLVVKIDIEGGEYALLPALAEVLPERCRKLLVAFHPALLAGAGIGAAEVARRTRAAFEALSGFVPTVLEHEPPSGGSACDVAETRNVTVLFRRPGDLDRPNRP